MATLLSVEETKTPVFPQNGKSFTLKEKQGFVDGYVEHLHLRDGRVLLVNEEGRLKGMRLNHEATRLYKRDIVVGPAVVCTRLEAGYQDKED